MEPPSNSEPERAAPVKLAQDVYPGATFDSVLVAAFKRRVA